MLRSDLVAATATSRGRATLVTLLFTVLALFPLAATAAATDKGLMDETLARSNKAADRARFFKAVKSSRTTFVRTYVEWDGKRTFPLPNEIVPIRRMAMEAAEAGVKKIHVDFTGKLGETYDDAREIDLVAYQTMVAATAYILRDLPLEVVYSPWNESNYHVLLPKLHGPETWRKMQNLAFDAIQVADPDALVAAGEFAPYARNKKLATDPGVFLREALGLSSGLQPRSGTTDEEYAVRADVFTLHPYDYLRNPNSERRSANQWTVTNLPRTISNLKKMAAAGRLSEEAPKTVIGTEFAYLAGTSQKISESRASLYLKRAWRKVESAKLDGFLWFQLKDPPTGTFKSGLTDAKNKRRKVFTTFVKLR